MSDLPESPVPPARKPIPFFVWATLGLLSLSAVLCFVVAIMLAPNWPPKFTLPVAGTAAASSEAGLARPPLSDPPASPNQPGPVTPVNPAQPAQPSGTLPPITEYEVPAILPVNTSPSQPSETTPSPSATVTTSQPRLAIVIDDMGQDVAGTTRALAVLPPDVTFAFLPYPPQTPSLARQAHDQGHTIIVHIPMQPLPHGAGTAPLDPGPDTLMLTDTPSEITRKLNAAWAPLADLAVGANNHMGSAFTGHGNEAGMRSVLQFLNAKNRYFLDSVTVANTATQAAASQISLSVPLFRRDIFLDHVPTEAAITAQLEQAFQRARHSPVPVIAIGHPHPATLNVLQRKLPELIAATGVELVSLTATLR